MYALIKNMQQLIDEMDAGIRAGETDMLTLKRLSAKFGYSAAHFSRVFYAISGMQLHAYLKCRKLALALMALRDTDARILDVALQYGYQSHEAFTRAFKSLYGMTPAAYRKNPVPIKLRTILKPFDCYLMEKGGVSTMQTNSSVRTYFVTIPAHKFLHIRNYESIGYFDFWQKQSRIPGQDCETVCGLLASIPGKLDDLGGEENDSGAGQLMAFLNHPAGRICSWGIPLAECYGARLPVDFEGPVPEGMLLMDVPEGDYLVFEHGPFDYEKENAAVEAKIEEAMKYFDYASSGYTLDLTPGRLFYFYHDCTRYWKYVRPVKKV